MRAKQVRGRGVDIEESMTIESISRELRIPGDLRGAARLRHRSYEY